MVGGRAQQGDARMQQQTGRCSARGGDSHTGAYVKKWLGTPGVAPRGSGADTS
jgi:hypothetical protein